MKICHVTLNVVFLYMCITVGDLFIMPAVILAVSIARDMSDT